MTYPLDVEDWLREKCSRYDFGLRGTLRRGALDVHWPLRAVDIDDLEEKLVGRGLLAPLPSEPAALANVIEVSILDFLLEAIQEVPGADAVRGTERGYPDLEISGSGFGGGVHAVDVKAARLKDYTKGSADPQTQSRITLYTGNTYFKYPDLHMDGAMRPFGEYASHLDIIVLYRFAPHTRARITDMEVIVQQPWKIASRKVSSTTREYIGAVMTVSALREGRGEFASPQEFYSYWRKFPFKESAQVRNRLQRELKAQREEIARLRSQGGSGER